MADLIVYFSRNYENYVSGAIRNLDVGNTEVAACIIQQLTGADLFKLEPIQEYSRNYNECIAEAQADQRRIRPFCTHEGSGMGRSEVDIRRLCRGADIKPGLAIQGAKASLARKEIEGWI